MQYMRNIKNVQESIEPTIKYLQVILKDHCITWARIVRLMYARVMFVFPHDQPALTLSHFLAKSNSV